MKNNPDEFVDLSVVILCYRSGDKIKKFVFDVLQLLENNNISSFELILVGNYSRGIEDETPKIVAELSVGNPKIRFIAKEKKGMMGWDMKSGLELARGNYLVVTDGDGQMPVVDILRVYKKIRNESLDLVKTCRIQRGDSFWRKVISFFYNNIFKILFPGTKSKDINSKPKIFSRQAYRRLSLKSDDWFIDAEIMIQTQRLGLRVGEVSTVFLGLEGRRSFIKLGAIVEFIKNLIIYRLREFKYFFKKDLF